MAAPSDAPSSRNAATPASAKPHRALRGKVAHATRGRMRLQFPGATPAELQRIEGHIRTMPHVHDVEVHPRTGSIIAHHAPGHGQFRSHLEDLARHSALFYLDLGADPTAAATQLTDVEHDAAYLADHSRVGKTIVRYAEHLNRAVKIATGGWVDLRVLLPATIGVCALIFVEVESSPLWVPLALFSFQSFNNLHQPHATTEAEAAHPLNLPPPAPAGATPGSAAPAVSASAPAESAPSQQPHPAEAPTPAPARPRRPAKKAAPSPDPRPHRA